MPSPSHFSWFDHPNYIWWRVGLHTVKYHIMHFSPAAFHFSKYPPSLSYTSAISVCLSVYQTKFYINCHDTGGCYPVWTST
jgi:hypothetical protein